MSERLLAVFRTLFDHFGPQGWWPAETPFAVIVGAILTQSVSWRNAERAIDELRRRDLLDPVGLFRIPEEELAEFLRPAGYYRAKARKLKAFLQHLFSQYGGNLQGLLDRPTEELRGELLALYGIGPETADSIVLYAAGKPSFVVDAYTLRIFSRLRILPAGTKYEEARRFFQGHLPPDRALFNEYHALLVALGKDFCWKSGPRCAGCPLKAESLCAASDLESADKLRFEW
ncbi:MAG: endonuclease III domain-containing protein [Firmicutes bacterium]|nr:endonuclease III domain-containing protein [Bacillota bacterium]